MLKKRSYRLISIFLSLLMLSALIAGCGETAVTPTSTPAAPANSKSPESTGEQTKEPMEISIAFWDIGKCFPDGVVDEVYEEFKKATNVIIKPINTTWDDNNEMIQLWANSNELPDIFTGAFRFGMTTMYDSWIEQEIIKQLPNDLSQYPNLQESLSQPALTRYANSDGTFYCIPRQTYPDARDIANSVAFFIRKDWMDACNITGDPESLDDLIEICKAFTEGNPDGDNIDNTIGLTAWSKSRALYPLLALNPYLLENKWVQVDGQWIPSFFTDKALPALKEYKRLYDSGYVDKDIPLLKGSEGMDKFFADNAGIFIHQNYLEPSQIATFNDMHEGQTWGDLVTTIHLWPYEDGKYYYTDSNPCWSENYIRGNIDDEKLERILEMFDWMLTSEWDDLRHYGIEGKDYVRNGDEIEITRPKDETGTYVLLMEQYPMLTMMNQFIDWDTTFKMFEDPSMDEGVKSIYSNLRQWYHNNTVSNVVNWDVELMDTPSKIKTSAIDYDSNLWKIIMSEDIDTTYEQVYEEMMQAGYSEYIKEVNEAVVD